MPITVDRSAHPLVQVHARDDLGADDIRRYLVELDEIVKLGRFGMQFTVVQHFKVKDRSAVGLMAMWFKHNAEISKRNWVGLTLVFKSPIARLLMSSLLLVGRLPMPYDVVESEEEGWRFLARRFREEKLPLPERLR